MNDPRNLKKFIRLLGVPLQPYRLIQYEISNTILKKFMSEFHQNFTEEFKRIKG